MPRFLNPGFLGRKVKDENRAKPMGLLLKAHAISEGTNHVVDQKQEWRSWSVHPDES